MHLYLWWDIERRCWNWLHKEDLIMCESEIILEGVFFLNCQDRPRRELFYFVCCTWATCRLIRRKLQFPFLNESILKWDAVLKFSQSNPVGSSSITWRPASRNIDPCWHRHLSMWIRPNLYALSSSSRKFQNNACINSLYISLTFSAPEILSSVA